MATILGTVLIIAIFFVWFFIHQAKEKERLLLIEKGVDVSELPERNNFSLKFSIPWLKLGCITIAIAVGIVAAFISFKLFHEAGSEGAIPFAVLLFFGGLGLIAAHFIGKNSAKINKK